MRRLEPQQTQTALMLLAALLLGAEIMWISQRFDALGLTLRGDVVGWRSLFSQLGNIAKLGVAVIFTTALVLHTRLAPLWHNLQQQVSLRRFCLLLPLHLAFFALLLRLTQTIFGDPSAAAKLPAHYYLAWLLACAGSLLTWLYLFTSNLWLRRFFREERLALAVGAGIGTFVWVLALTTRNLWGPMSEATFLLAAIALYAVNGEQMIVDVEDKILGLGEFVVNIAPACSGYEGIGLVTAFTAIYLWLHRQQLRFPRVLLLFPLAAAAIWLLNVVRIVVLILLGHHWSPEVAVGGFHSQAGWLTFIMTALGILWLAGDSRYFRKQSAQLAPSSAAAPEQQQSANSVVALLVPLVTLLASTLITSSLSAGFDWLYPLRVLAVGISLVYVWRHLNLRPYRLHPLAPAAGLFIAVLWVLMLGGDDAYNHDFSQSLAEAPLWLTGGWLLLRFVGAVITVPIAEELAFRGYLLCKLSGTEVSTRGGMPFAIVGVVASSLAFGALHGAWLAGTVAGLVYALVRLRTRHIGDAIVAHGLTNAVLFAYASISGNWYVL